MTSIFSNMINQISNHKQEKPKPREKPSTVRNIKSEPILLPSNLEFVKKEKERLFKTIKDAKIVDDNNVHTKKITTVVAFSSERYGILKNENLWVKRLQPPMSYFNEDGYRYKDNHQVERWGWALMDSNTNRKLIMVLDEDFDFAGNPIESFRYFNSVIKGDTAYYPTKEMVYFKVHRLLKGNYRLDHGYRVELELVENYEERKSFSVFGYRISQSLLDTVFNQECIRRIASTITRDETLCELKQKLNTLPIVMSIDSSVDVEHKAIIQMEIRKIWQLIAKATLVTKRQNSSLT